MEEFAGIERARYVYTDALALSNGTKVLFVAGLIGHVTVLEDDFSNFDVQETGVKNRAAVCVRACVRACVRVFLFSFSFFRFQNSIPIDGPQYAA